MTKTYTICGMRKIVFIFFILAVSIYFLTSAGTTPYDYFTRLADSFLEGKYYLTDNPPWLNELVPLGENKFAVVYPPMPAILSLPFRFFLGLKFEQQYLAHILGAGIGILTMLISWKIKKDKRLALWSGLLISFGSIIWFLASTGSSWYLGQISAAFFLTFAIYEALNKKRPVVVGILLGAAYLSRIHTILSLPLFLYIFFDKKLWFKNYLKMFLGFLPFALFNFSYNLIRFGVIWDKAYILIPGVLEEPWYEKGLFHLSNIPHHLNVIFASYPVFTTKFPYIKPSWGGLAIWITTPAFIYALFNGFRDKIILFSWIPIILISILIFSHGTTGFAQFGYRFAVDFYPILTFLTIKSVAHSGPRWHHWFLLVIGILVNLWGVLWINKFGYVG